MITITERAKEVYQELKDSSVYKIVMLGYG